MQAGREQTVEGGVDAGVRGQTLTGLADDMWRHMLGHVCHTAQPTGTGCLANIPAILQPVEGMQQTTQAYTG